ncbi:thioesterase family protein [Lampropedia aestuarii]|uniref:Thioesterase family protein n=1 Tax=Lampropedia aestuarii TaxID=2562762 RepID=A0A4V6S7A2_9BURK|nr:thioesterase family protein [Lampropedia aestuarii]MDH5857454.1 thioesterase family protein [Lampropedia aestuarii]THJ35282.1 thioesterase family protein [Lampropedia aestuarii]
MTASVHSFDDAIALSRDELGNFHGRTTPAYRNMIGPFGGITAAVLLNAVLQHPERLGEPTALTVNYAGAVPDGPFRIVAKPVRTNRSSQHWIVEQWVLEDGQECIATTATVLTTARKATWAGSDIPAPLTGGPAAGITPLRFAGVPPWFEQFDMIPLTGAIPSQWDGQEHSDSTSRLWVRHAAPRALDYCSLTAACDVFYPRIWLKRALRVPAGTVSMTIYFHANQAMLDSTGTGYLLAQAKGQEFRDNYADQSGQIWSQDGSVLATTHQLAYFKE